MKPASTVDGVEAEATLIRSQLVALGGDIRRHADPVVVFDTVKASFNKRSQAAPAFLKENATPLGMLILGGTFGAVVTGLYSPRRRSKRAAESVEATPMGATSSPAVRTQIKAALISALGVGLGYVAGFAVPATAAEDRFLGELKAVLSERLDQFLQQHMRGMKHTALNMFGASRLSATTLIALAMLAEALGAPRPRGKTNVP